GWLARADHLRQDRLAVRRQFALVELFHAGGDAAKSTGTHATLDRLEREGALWRNPGGSRELTSFGWQEAVAALRRERLWTAFLEEYPEQTALFRDLAGGDFARAVGLQVAAEIESRVRAAGDWPETPPGKEGAP
ncbi:MAG TPA: hypothetical protein VNC50_11375, partial [Planctomycetia bacterium]|nr:hypothetical protein [Planctomycetia bacterium]